jgi:hypothetical protein
LGERAYCYGFVDASVADAVIKRMWETDKYVARCIDVKAASRGDEKLYDALSDYGRIGVTRTECEGVVNWHTRASPVVEPGAYECNYGRFVYHEQRGNPPDADGERAIRHVGPYKEHPVPRTAVCLLCVDMRLGRRADARDGLFTQLEAALRFSCPVAARRVGKGQLGAGASRPGSSSQNSRGRSRSRSRGRSRSRKGAQRSKKAKQTKKAKKTKKSRRTQRTKKGKRRDGFLVF